MRRRPPRRDTVAAAPVEGPLREGIEIRTERLAMGICTSEGTATIRLSGVLDATSGELLVRVAQRLVRAGNPHVAVDCGGLSSCGAAGLAALGTLARMPEVGSLDLVGAAEDLAITGRREERDGGHVPA